MCGLRSSWPRFRSGSTSGSASRWSTCLRQCLIALRLADRLGLDDQTRSAVYYTALLMNVGCHSDAHEQAKWFGDDIALKSDKYEYEFRSVRGAVSGAPPDRIRVIRRFIAFGSAWSSRSRDTASWTA